MKTTPTPLTVSVSDAALMLGVSRWTVYAMGRRGELTLVRLGETNRTVIPYAELVALVQGSKRIKSHQQAS